MKVLLIVCVLLVVGVVGFGFYEGWFQLSTNTTDHKSSVTVGVNQDQIQADKKKLEDLEHKAK